MEEEKNPNFPRTNSANLPPMWKSCRKDKASSMARKDVVKECNRREKMNEFYAELQSIVPNLFPKATKSRIVEETMSYIKTLEEAILAHGGTTKKPPEVCNASDVPFHAPRSSFVSVDVSADVAFFGIISAPSRNGIVTKVAEVFEKHKAGVLAATVACGGGTVSMTITASLPEQADAASIKADLLTI